MNPEKTNITEQADVAKTQTVARLNDLFRRTLSPCLGRAVLTRSVAESRSCDQVVQAVRKFDAFTLDNDPYREHDFGDVTVDGEKYFFKVDYYDQSLSRWSDPLADETVRVLTIMRADEY